MRPLPAISVLVALNLLLGACGFLNDQVHIASTGSCIHHTCRGEPDAPGYQQCESACRSAYGK